MASFIRKAPTVSGAWAVQQIVHKQGRRVVGIEHIGSAHDDAQLAVLMEIARQQLHAVQESLDLGLAEPATSPSTASPPRPATTSGPRVAGKRSRLLWDVLAGAYSRLGFDALGDEAFKALVLGRIIEPTSKADTLRVLDELGIAGPSLRTVFRALTRSIKRDSTATGSRRPAWRTRRPRQPGRPPWCSTTARRCTSRPRRRTSSARSG